MTGVEISIIVLTGVVFTCLCVLGYALAKISTQHERIKKLEGTVASLEEVLDISTYGLFSHRLDKLSYKVDAAHERIDDLPSEKARVVQAKIDELEKMVKELK